MTNREKLFKILSELSNEDLGRVAEAMSDMKIGFECLPYDDTDRSCPAAKFCRENVGSSPSGGYRPRLVELGDCSDVFTEWLSIKEEQ